MSKSKFWKKFKKQLRNLGKLTTCNVLSIWKNKTTWLWDMFPSVLTMALFNFLLFVINEERTYVKLKQYDTFDPQQGLLKYTYRRNLVNIYPKERQDIVDLMANTSDSRIEFLMEDSLENFNYRIDFEGGRHLCGIRFFKKKKIIDIKYPPKLRIIVNDRYLTWETEIGERLLENIITKNFTVPEEGALPYYHEGFLGILESVAIALLTKSGDTDHLNVKVKMKPTSMKNYKYDGYYKQIFDSFPLIIIVAMQAPTLSFVLFLLNKRRNGLMDRLLTRGVSEIVINTSFIIYGIIYSTGMIVLFLIGLKANFYERSILPKTDVIFLALLFFLSIMVYISFNGMVTAIFRKDTVVFCIGILYLWLTLIPYIIILRGGHNSGFLVYILVTLCPNTAIASGIKLILIAETLNMGLRGGNVFLQVSPRMNCSFVYIIGSLFGHILIYTFVWFLLEHYHWPKFKPLSLHIRAHVNWKSGLIERHQIDFSQIFQEYEVQNIVLMIFRDVSKKTRKSTILSNISFTLREGKVTIVMGPIGCGKSTLLRLMARLMKPSSGDIIVKQGFHNSIGYTKQFSRYTSKFSVRSDLIFYATVAGLKEDYLYMHVNRIIDIMDLTNYQDVPFDNLPRGYKKRATIAYAFVGGPKFIILDYPDDGLDASGLECLKKAIITYRQASTIVLSLSDYSVIEDVVDNLIILKNGTIVANGSLEELSNQYDSGYYLRVIKISEMQETKYFLEPLKEVVSNIETTADVGFLICFSLPMDTNIEKVKEVLDNLEMVQYEIFRTDIRKIYNCAMNRRFPREKYQELIDFSHYPRYSGNDLSINTFYALLLKHLYILRHRWISYFIAYIVFSIIVFMTLSRYIRNPSILNPLKLSFSSYDVPIVLIGIENDTIGSHERFEIMKEYLISKGVQYMVIAKDAEGFKNLAIFARIMSYRVACIYNFGWKENVDLITYNARILHSPAISLAEYYRAFLDHQHVSVEFRNHPFPQETWEFVCILLLDISVAVAIFVAESKSIQLALPKIELLLDGRNTFLLDISSAIMLPVALFFTFVIFYCYQESNSKFKDVQVTSGASLLVYWGTTFIVVMFMYSLSMVFILVPVLIIVYFYTGGSVLSVNLFIITITYGMVMTVNAFNKAYKSDVTSEIHSISMGYMLGSVLTVRIMSGLLTNYNYLGIILQVISQSFNYHSMFVSLLIKTMTDAYCEEMTEQCMLLPHDSRYHKEMEVMCAKHVASSKVQCREDEKQMNQLGMASCLAIMFLAGGWNLLKLYWQSGGKRLFRLNSQIPKFTDSVFENEEVTKEKNKIRSYRFVHMKIPRLLMKDITIIEKNQRLLNGICLEVNDQETLVLLGTNNSYPMGIFEILTQQKQPTQGVAYINGMNVEDSANKHCNNFASNYDIQAFQMGISVKEFLTVMGMLRGFSFKNSQKISNELAEYFEYDEYMNELLINLCCGFLKKISNSLLFLGVFPLLLVKNPALDLDLFGRLMIYHVIALARRRGQSLIIRTYLTGVNATLATRTAFMSKDCITSLNTPHKMLQQYQNGLFLYMETRMVISRLEIRRALKRYSLHHKVLITKGLLHVLFVTRISSEELEGVMESVRIDMDNAISEFRVKVPSFFQLYYQECLREV